MKPDLETIRKMRKCWRPKRPETKTTCASCPFRDDNDDEFGAILAKLASACGRDPDAAAHPAAVEESRQSIRGDVDAFGDFGCHCTAYTDDMERRPDSELRQCAGASAFYRDGGNHG